jgi:hypothetical protein
MVQTQPYKRLYALGAEFNSAAAIYKAAEKVRDSGYSAWDCHSPFPIHGMDKAMGMPKSWLSAFVFVCGVAGFLTGLGLVAVTSFGIYPTVVNGKPNNWSDGLLALQFFFPVMYELTILCASFGAVFGMIIRNGLPRFHHPIFNWSRFSKVTDDKFFIVIEARDPKFSETRTKALLEEVGGQHITPVYDQD